MRAAKPTQKRGPPASSPHAPAQTAALISKGRHTVKATRDPTRLVAPEPGPDEDPYRTSTRTTVVAVAGRKLVLDDTAFLPRQADKGTIATSDDALVYPVDCVTVAGGGHLCHWL